MWNLSVNAASNMRLQSAQELRHELQYTELHTYTIPMKSYILIDVRFEWMQLLWNAATKGSKCVRGRKKKTWHECQQKKRALQSACFSFRNAFDLVILIGYSFRREYLAQKCRLVWVIQNGNESDRSGKKAAKKLHKNGINIRYETQHPLSSLSLSLTLLL